MGRSKWWQGLVWMITLATPIEVLTIKKYLMIPAFKKCDGLRI